VNADKLKKGIKEFFGGVLEGDGDEDGEWRRSFLIK